MKDFRVVQAKALLKVSSISPIRGFLPPAIIVLGEKFDLASEIYYNEVEVKEYYIASSTRMIIRVPQSQVGQPLKEIKVLAEVAIAQQNAIASLSLSKPPRTVSGVDRLVQMWTLVFLSTPGSDIFSPQNGGGGRSLIGKSKGMGSVAADLALAVERTKVQILQAQASNPRIPADERLLSATLTTVQVDEKAATISAVVDIRNALGDAAQVSLG